MSGTEQQPAPAPAPVYVSPEPAPPPVTMDTMVTLPLGLRAASERADMLQRQLAAQARGEPFQQAPQPAPGGGEGGGAEAGGMGSQPVAVPPLALPQPPAEAPVQPVEAQTVQPEQPPADSALLKRIEDAEATARTWAGRAKAMQETISSLTAKIAGLETNIASLVEKASSVPPPAAVANPLSAEEMDEYGADLFDKIQRFVAPMIEEAGARHAQAALVAAKQEVAGIQTALERRQVEERQTAFDGFLNAVRKQVPDFDALDVDPAFLAWLKEVDPFFGLPRENALDNAAKNLDVDRAVAVYKAFLYQQGAPGQQALQAASTVPQGTGPYPPPAPPPENGLAVLAAPGRPNGAQAPVSVAPEPEIWTRQEIAAFYTDVRRGKFKGREAERDAYERRIALAQQEGRVR